jgi:hypothetical protein
MTMIQSITFKTIKIVVLLVLIMSTPPLVLGTDNPRTPPTTAAIVTVPELINYQGVLMDNNGNPLNATVSITFRLYDKANGGAILWEEIHSKVTVQNGVFNVLLGSVDTLSVNKFKGKYRWIGVEIGTDGEMTPRQRIASVPYAYKVHGLDVDKQGRVGIGTPTPSEELEVIGNARIDGELEVTGEIDPPAIIFTPLASAPVEEEGKVYYSDSDDELYVYDSSTWQPLIGGAAPSGDNYSLDADDGDPEDALYVDGSGKVGIGTTEPDDKLDVEGILRISGVSSNWRFMSHVSNGNLYIRDETKGKYRVTIDSSGHVGIGTSTPSARLEIDETKGGTPFKVTTTGLGGDFSIDEEGRVKILAKGVSGGSSQPPTLQVIGNGDDNPFQVRSSGETGLIVRNDGNVGIGTTIPTEKLTVKGNILLKSETTGDEILELGEGLDYAEGFDVSDHKDIDPGTVLIIDPENTGMLKISDSPYDSKVAGIVAGAGGIGSGVKLGHGRFDKNVALAGRVFCNVDATDQGIEPGDLLTTSEIPGHAMKATDRNQAHGAILGKAMEKLEKGSRGQILVLVTLQ